jgi:hypothetical protein
MTNQEYWDLSLTYRGRAKVLHLIGQNQDYQQLAWAELPEDVRNKLVILWSRHIP